MRHERKRHIAHLIMSELDKKNGIIPKTIPEYVVNTTLPKKEINNYFLKNQKSKEISYSLLSHRLRHENITQRTLVEVLDSLRHQKMLKMGNSDVSEFCNTFYA